MGTKAKQPRRATEAPLDLYRDRRAEYAATTTPTFVDVGPGTFLAVEGTGPPGGERFQEAVGALYGVAYTIKMTRKHRLGIGPDYKIAPLEGLYWTEGEEDLMAADGQTVMSWQLLVRKPEFITQTDVGAAAAVLEAKGRGAGARHVRVVAINEGRCVQVLHVGPYETEPATVETMRAFAAAAGVAFRGRHHEIYLSDPRRVPPERLKTILRYPVG